MFFGYNTNGFAHHRLDDAIAILADLGYEGVALTVDHHVLNPFETDWRREAERVRKLLERRRLRCVVETGSRFLLDPRRKHQPTLLCPTQAERDVRLDFLSLCIELAKLVGADVVSLWSGTPQDHDPDDILWARLTDGCRRLIDRAQRYGVRLAFEPEPGMFVDTMQQFQSLMIDLAPPPSVFGLTLDIGHLHCLGETPIADHIERWKDVLWNVHLDDMRHGVHDHLALGEGEIDFPPVLESLKKSGYAGGAYLELSRHSHDAVRVAERSLKFLREASSPALIP